MARGVNKAIILGNLGGDPDLRSTPGGISVASFSIATSEQWKDKQTGETKERTEWHRCEAWGRLAEICSEYLHKGSKVYVEGSIRTDKWTDKEGIERYTTKIRIEELQMLDGKLERGQVPAARASAPATTAAPSTGPYDDDIPF